MYGFDHTTHNWEAVALDTNGKLEVSASLDTTGLATETTLSAISTGQGDGSQITKIRGDVSGTARDVLVDTNGKYYEFAKYRHHRPRGSWEDNSDRRIAPEIRCVSGKSTSGRTGDGFERSGA